MKIAILAYKAPRKKSSQGFLSAEKGEIRDSRTIATYHRISFGCRGL